MSDKLLQRAHGFSEWYVDLVQKAKLADYSDVKGCMVIRPNGYAIWENMQRVLDRMFKDTGHQNAYFPLLIPESFLRKEAEHVDGFNPQLAVVTHAGGKKLEEPYVIRPTSETIINSMFARWIHSYRDLPMLINQWANVMRWEMRTRLFLRTTEFLWQEGHTCHETEDDAEQETRKMLEVYRSFAEDYMAMPVITGPKSESEKFPVIIVIGKTADERRPVLERANALAADLRKQGLGVLVDDDETKGPGFKYFEYELIGVCVRVELGPKDLAKEQCVMVRRDNRQKEFVPLAQAVDRAKAMLDAMQADLFAKAKKHRDEHTFVVGSYDELKKRADDGFLVAHWCLDPGCEKKVKEDLAVTTRNRPFDVKQEKGRCVVCDKESPGRIVFSKAY